MLVVTLVLCLRFTISPSCSMLCCIADLAPLVEDQHKDFAAELKKIPSVSCGVVNLQYEDLKLPFEVLFSCRLSAVLLAEIRLLLSKHLYSWPLISSWEGNLT